MNGYNFSRDYDRLQELLDGGRKVICLADYKVDGLAFRDICTGIKTESYYVFHARGIEYCRFYPEYYKRYPEKYPKTFAEMVGKHNIEFLDIKE